jgi:hypothetical protein
MQKPVAKPRKTTPVDVRITVDEAFQRLRRREEPAAACERLNAAIRAGRVRLWANDSVVEPSWFVGHVYVAANAAPDGRWTAAMTMIRAVAEWPDIEWIVSSADVLKQETESKHHPGGRPPKYDAEQIRFTAFHYVHDYGLPATQDELIRKLRQELGDKMPEKTRAEEIIGPFFKYWKAKSDRK